MFSTTTHRAHRRREGRHTKSFVFRLVVLSCAGRPAPRSYSIPRSSTRSLLITADTSPPSPSQQYRTPPPRPPSAPAARSTAPIHHPQMYLLSSAMSGTGPNPGTARPSPRAATIAAWTLLPDMPCSFRSIGAGHARPPQRTRLGPQLFAHRV